MSKQTYWRGYIDGQAKKHYLNKTPIVTAELPKRIRGLADILGTKVEDYRGGLFMVELPNNYEKKFPQKYDADYLRGWFDAKGQVYKDPLKLTICGEGLELFRNKLQKELGMKLPKLQRPSVTSSVMRMILTGEKAKIAHKFLRP